MRASAALLSSCLAVVLGSEGALAQERARMAMSVHAGLYAPLGDLGPAAPAGGVWFLQLDRTEPTPSLGVTAELPWPSRTVGFRVTGLYLLPTGASGRFDCAPGLACPAVLLQPSAVDVDVLVVRGDVVLSPLRRSGRPRPYALLGGGLKRYTFSWSETGELIAEGRHRETALAVHAGLGVTFDLLRTAFWAEVSDYWSAEGDPVAPGFEPGGLPAPRRDAQHDLGVTLGWRLLKL